MSRLNSRPFGKHIVNHDTSLKLNLYNKGDRAGLRFNIIHSTSKCDFRGPTFCTVLCLASISGTNNLRNELFKFDSGLGVLGSM